MNRKLMVLIFWFARFLVGVAAYVVVTNLPSGNTPPINPEFVWASISGLLGSVISLSGLFLFVRVKPR